MGEKCCGCGKEFVAGDAVLTFRMERVLRGQKSNALGFYEIPNSLKANEEDHVDHAHFLPGCIEKTFSPPENPFMFDVIAAQVREEIYEEERQKDPDEFFPELPSLIDDPPFCLWCKRTDTVWFSTFKGYPVFNCLSCKKLWDHDEDELYWDSEKGDYFLVPTEEKKYG